RESPAELSPEEFRAIGHRLVDQVADFLDTIDSRPVAPSLAPREVRGLIGADAPVPDAGQNALGLLEDMARVLFANSTLNGHPRFFGYITSSAAPIGALAEMLATSVNANCGAWALSPVATEMERQVTRWIAELIGFSPAASGIL